MTRETNVTTPRSAEQEARDPSTSPDRLLELTRDHPELQSLIVTNPACPAVARDWILASNPEAKQLSQEDRTAQGGRAGDAAAAGEAGSTDPADVDPDGVSVWGDIFDQPAAPTPVGRSQTVRVPAERGVVPLGAAGTAEPRSPGPGTPAPPPPAKQPAGRDRRGLWIACCGCAVLALVLVAAAVLGGRYLWGGDDDSYQRSSSDPAAAQTQQTESAEESEEPEPDPVSPAPEGALELDEIRSPTGNITCSLDGGSVGCSVADRDFSDSGLEDCEQGPFSIEVADGEAATACGQSFDEPSSQTLEYDTSAVSEDVACTSAFDGMTCWNTLTGKGFFVNRTTYETF